MLQSLAAQNSLDAQLLGSNAAVPEWASTHPDPASRVQNAQQLAQAAGAGGVTNRDTFLARIDGLMYGDDPKQGMIEGQTFIHPEYRLTFTAPQGFYMMNGTSAVSINGDAGKAQFSTAPFNGDLSAYVTSVFKALGGDQTTLAPQSIQNTTVNGIPAAVGNARVDQRFAECRRGGLCLPIRAAIRHSTLRRSLRRGRRACSTPLFQSMRRISSAEAGAVVPRRIDVVTAGRSDTVASFSRRMAFADAQEQRFRVLNGLFGNAELVAGQRYKIVVRAR